MHTLRDIAYQFTKLRKQIDACQDMDKRDKLLDELEITMDKRDALLGGNK